MTWLRTLPVLVLLTALPARAVDNSTHVLGLGADATFSSQGVEPLLSAKFALRPRVELSLLFGMQIAANSGFDPGAKFDYVLLPEKNMNLYVQASVLFDVRTQNGLNAFLYRVGPGVELFFSEFPNLGIALEFGLSGSVATQKPVAGVADTNLSTDYATGFGSAGVHYYF
jgi:hypothetical protein